MVFKVSGLFNQLNNKLGLGATEQSEPKIPHIDSAVSKSNPEQRSEIQEPPVQGLSEPNEKRVEHAETVNAEAPIKRSQAKRTSSGLKPETPMRQRWRRSAVRAVKKAQGLDRRYKPSLGRTTRSLRLGRKRS